MSNVHGQLLGYNLFMPLQSLKHNYEYMENELRFWHHFRFRENNDRFHIFKMDFNAQ